MPTHEFLSMYDADLATKKWPDGPTCVYSQYLGLDLLHSLPFHSPPPPRDRHRLPAHKSGRTVGVTRCPRSLPTLHMTTAPFIHLDGGFQLQLQLFSHNSCKLS